MTLHAYATGPIDWGWGLLRRLNTFAAELAEEEGYIDNEDENNFEHLMSAGGDIVRRLEKAQALARKVGWEGDVRGSVYVFVVPGDDVEMMWGFVWKQDNNGTTFVVSPVELPHLGSEHVVS